MKTNQNRLTLIRSKYSDKQTEGTLYVIGQLGEILFSCVTLELPWRNNQVMISCIPKGVYKVVPRNSPKYGDHLHILDVPGRTLILIHQANYVDQLLGCIAVGESWSDINKDGLLDVTASVATKNRLLAYIQGLSSIEIK